MTRRPPTRGLIFAGVLLATAAAAWLIVIQPRREATAAMREQLTEQEKVLAQLDALRGESLRRLQDDVQTLKEATELFASRLPEEQKLETFIQGLNQLARSNELRSKKIQTKSRIRTPEEEASRAFREQIIVVQLEGPFEGVYGFLQAIENQPRIIRVEKLSIEAKDVRVKDNTGQVEANMDLVLFFRKGEE